MKVVVVVGEEKADVKIVDAEGVEQSCTEVPVGSEVPVTTPATDVGELEVGEVAETEAAEPDEGAASGEAGGTAE